MFASTALAHSSRFRIGWIALIVLTALMTLNHFVLIFALDDPVLFIGYTAFNLYALVVILIPFGQGEKWAWLTTWILPLALAIPGAMEPNLVIFYTTFAALSALGLLLTLPDFFSRGQPSKNI